MKREQGSVMLLVLLISAVFAVLAPVAGTIATSEARIARSHAVQNTAQYIAEAGLELAMARLRSEKGYTTPANTPITGATGGGSYSVNVTAGTGSERIITSTGNWGGGQQRAAARVTFTPNEFLFRHAFLSGGTVKIRNSTIVGPVHSQGLDNEQSQGNTFSQGQPLTGNVAGSPVAEQIPPVDFMFYSSLAGANPSLWHVVNNDDLDAAIRTANSLSRQRILVNAGDNATVELSLRGSDPPANFHGLIVIRAKTVRFRDNINAAPNNTNQLVILTTGNIDNGPGGGSSADNLGNNTLLYSNGTVSLTRSEGATRLRLNGITVAEQGGASPRDVWNADMAFNDAMLPLLMRDAQPGFYTMSVVYTRPQP